MTIKSRNGRFYLWTDRLVYLLQGWNDKLPANIHPIQSHLWWKRHCGATQWYLTENVDLFFLDSGSGEKFSTSSKKPEERSLALLSGLQEILQAELLGRRIWMLAAFPFIQGSITQQCKISSHFWLRCLSNYPPAEPGTFLTRFCTSIFNSLPSNLLWIIRTEWLSLPAAENRSCRCWIDSRHDKYLIQWH